MLTDDIKFEPDAYVEQMFWAIDDDNVEYCIYMPEDEDIWCAYVQRRVAYNEVRHSLGRFWYFEDAEEACRDFDPVEEGLL